ncbi:hypothetical protein [Leuconostoc rapi]|uniref:hypothetical protein n=1 Tax=Leuconostoc rapi TaxID=1406906 RepID=UPI0019586C95|nr:hypothetical protein [Leuconostoc rapi]MBM7435125.1 plasmid maintenance system antidote protein VapI [Leuconostoc rapi]
MTQELHAPEFTKDNLVLICQLLIVTQQALANAMDINGKTVNRFEIDEQKIFGKFVDKLLVVYQQI